MKAHLFNGRVIYWYGDQQPAPESVKGEIVDAVWGPTPEYDPATQSLSEGEPDVKARPVIRTIVVRPLTATELNAAADEVENQQIRQLVVALKAGTGTAGERIQRLERCVAGIIKRIL